MIRKNFMKKYNQLGFSLIEVAIGFVIIGLFAGVILKGRELIENARLQKTVSQILSFQVACHSFKEKYSALPGDWGGAQELWGEKATNGNQNGFLEGRGLESGSEAIFFWHHLTLAGLISCSEAPSSGLPSFGRGAPTCPLGGGFTVEDSPDDLEGLWMILGKQRGERGTGALLTPAQAQFLDQKLDTGNPVMGDIRALEGDGVPRGKCVLQGAYNLTVKDASCVLYVRLD